MRRLAELAHKDVEIALADLNQWRAERADDMATASIYASMKRHIIRARKLSGAACLGAFALGAVSLDPSNIAQANETGTNATNNAQCFILWEIVFAA